MHFLLFALAFAVGFLVLACIRYVLLQWFNPKGGKKDYGTYDPALYQKDFLPHVNKTKEQSGKTR